MTEEQILQAQQDFNIAFKQIRKQQEEQLNVIKKEQSKIEKLMKRFFK